MRFGLVFEARVGILRAFQALGEFLVLDLQVAQLLLVVVYLGDVLLLERVAFEPAAVLRPLLLVDL